MAVRCPYREDFVTVYAETREQSGVTVYCRSRIASWDGWPADVVDVLHGWNKDRRLRFVGMDTISRVPPQASFKCPDCERFINPSGSTAAKLDDALVCDDCVILRVRKWGALGRPETELEKCKRWQRNVQKKLVKYRYNAIAEDAYVKVIEGELRREWWINHGHDFHALYGDDGEMQCGRCLCDFKRDPIARLREVVTASRLAKAAEVSGG